MKVVIGQYLTKGIWRKLAKIWRKQWAKVENGSKKKVFCEVRGRIRGRKGENLE